MESRPQLVVVGGPNGAGKSTTAPILLRDLLGVREFVNADAIAQGLSGFQPEQVALAAGRVMLRRLRELAQQRRSFAFETTMASRSFAPWLWGLRESGYRVSLLFLWLRDPELAVARVSERVRSGGHAVPEDTIRRRFYGGLRNFFSLYQPLAGSWWVYDNSEAGAPRLIAWGDGRRAQVVAEPEAWAAIQRGAEQ